MKLFLLWKADPAYESRFVYCLLMGHVSLTFDFDSNKKVTEEIAVLPSKRIRNKISGYVTVRGRRLRVCVCVCVCVCSSSFFVFEGGLVVSTCCLVGPSCSLRMTLACAPLTHSRVPISSIRINSHSRCSCPRFGVILFCVLVVQPTCRGRLLGGRSVCAAMSDLAPPVLPELCMAVVCSLSSVMWFSFMYFVV